MQAESIKNHPNKKILRRDFRHFLQDELSSRCTRNPNYSLRSFAKALEVSPSALSAMMNEKRPITDKMKEKLGLRLGLSLEEIKKMISQPHGNSKLKDESLPADLFQQLTLDTFSVISEPHHYGLLELMKVQNFKWDPRWIAQRLNKTVSEIHIAIERLERIGLLERTDGGEFIDVTHGFSTDIREGLSSQAQRRFQERSLEQAIAAIQTVPVEFRDNTSMTLAINARDVDQAKKFIKDFRRKFCAKLESSPTLTEVYQLTISFVPLTNLTGDKK